MVERFNRTLKSMLRKHADKFGTQWDKYLSGIRKAQAKYKKHHDKKAKLGTFKIGEWVLVRFPHEETERMRKLSGPWHGPFRVASREDPDLTVTNVYFPGDAPIKIHQNRVSHCPKEFPAGYFWYGGKRKGTE